MPVRHEQLEVRTKGKGLYEITDDVQENIDRHAVRNGTVTVFVQHTSCSLLIMENADPTARRDLEEFFEVAARSRIGIFHNQKAATGVLNKDSHRSVSHCMPVDVLLHIIGDFVQPLTFCANFQLFMTY